jgi:hypothetical protein
LAGEFAAENEALRDEIGRPQVDLEGTQAELEAGRKAAEEECVQLSNALVELERLKHDDSAAARMVSRYMYVYTFPRPALLASSPSHRKFSQATTDTLQGALESLKARHAATTSTLHVQLASTQAALAAERRQSARLRDVLDEATEQLARETYGRRREIALRLAVVGREDQLAEALRRWVRRTQETRAREDVSAGSTIRATLPTPMPGAPSGRGAAPSTRASSPPAFGILPWPPLSSQCRQVNTNSERCVCKQCCGMMPLTSPDGNLL